MNVDPIPSGWTAAAWIQNCIDNNTFVEFGPGPYTFGATEEVSGRSGVHLRFCGTTIIHPSTNANTFKWLECADSSMFDPLTIVGADGEGASHGILRRGGSRLLFRDITCKDIAGHGFYEYGGLETPRGDKTRWDHCAAYGCVTGREDAASAEYTVWTAFQAAGNGTGIITSAGNVQFNGGNVVDNGKGVLVSSGENHAHGHFVGMNINHNTDYDIKLDGVTYGESFTGCHVYGKVILSGSQGFSYIGGHMSGELNITGPAGFGVVRCYLPATLSLTGTHTYMSYDCVDAGGLWAHNT